MQKQQIAPWLLYQLETKRFSGLIWSNKQSLIFQITWERHGSGAGHDKTLEICKAYREEVLPNAKRLNDSKTKDRFHGAITKSPFVVVVEKEEKLQIGNYLLCQFKDFSASSEEASSFTQQQEYLTSVVVPQIEPMETNGQVSITQKNIDEYIAQLPQEQLNSYKFSLYYDGKLIINSDIPFNLSKKCRFHYGDALSQMKVAREKPYKKSHESKVADLMMPFVTFPPYDGDNDTTLRYLKESEDGVLLSSHNGCITAKRLCVNKIYHSGIDQLGRIEKLNRYEERVIFSLEDYARGVASKSYFPDEILLTYGKRPEQGVSCNVRLVIKPVLIPSILAFLGLPTSMNSSCSKSCEDSFDREVKEHRFFMNEIVPIMDQ